MTGAAETTAASAEQSAILELERRRARNALAQKRFRQRKKLEREQAKLKQQQKDSSSSSSSSRGSSTKSPSSSSSSTHSQSPEVAAALDVAAIETLFYDVNWEKVQAQTAAAAPKTDELVSTIQDSDLASWISTIVQPVLQTGDIQSLSPITTISTASSSSPSPQADEDHCPSIPGMHSDVKKRMDQVFDLIYKYEKPQMHSLSLLGVPANYIAVAIFNTCKRMGISKDLIRKKKIMNSPIRESWQIHLLQHGLSHTPFPLVSAQAQPKPEMHWRDVGENMHPTPTQLTIDHKLFLDCFPWPKFRERVILGIKSGILNEDEFGMDGVSHPTVTGTPAPFYIYADDTTDPDSWEFTPEYINKYFFLIDQEMIDRTNWWRKRRGLQPIRLPITA